MSVKLLRYVCKAIINCISKDISHFVKCLRSVSLSMLSTVVARSNMDVKMESVYRKSIWLLLRELGLLHFSLWLLIASDLDPNIPQICSLHQGVLLELGLVESPPIWSELITVAILKTSLRSLFTLVLREANL